MLWRSGVRNSVVSPEKTSQDITMAIENLDRNHCEPLVAMDEVLKPRKLPDVLATEAWTTVRLIQSLDVTTHLQS
jgi:hypothetical protein